MSNHNKISIAVASDIHGEFYPGQPDWIPPLPGLCDILILAGDLHIGDKVIHLLMRIANALPKTEIVWICGNHEFYRCSIDKQIERYRTTCRDMKRIHFLENESVQIQGYTFLGCCLWSGFDCLGKEHILTALHEAQSAINDFRLIRKGNGSKPFTPRDAREKFKESYNWLDRELAKSDPQKTIVITHFPPSKTACHKNIPENPLTPYFQADCEELIIKHKPKFWFYGHNHWSDILTIDKTRVVSNQLGYPDEAGFIPEFDASRLVYLE